MASSTPSVTPRLRVTRHPPVPFDRSIHTSTSEAVPSRLPDLSQLVNVTLNGIDMSDDNIYVSDVPTEHTTPQAPPRIETLSTGTQKDSPAAALRALLFRLPNSDGSPTRVNDKDTEYQYPSERESDYDIETASATTSVAQSSLKNIFNKALREPGDTPQKDRSHRRRSSSIGATDMDDTPHVLEARDIKGKRRSLSDDEVESARESASKSPARPRTRFKATPQPLTQEFLRKRFGEMANSPSNFASSFDSGVIPRLDSSPTTPPVATSTPQHSSRMSFENSQFKSNLLDRDSEMQNAIDALDSSTDNFSDRSVSPPPTLRVESEAADDNHTSDIRVMASKTRTVNDRPRTPSPNALTLNNKDSSVSASTIATRKNFGVYNLHDSLGERSMSLSLPAGHAILQPGIEERPRSSLSRHRSLSHMHSASSLRPSSPLPGQYRSHTPVDSAHDKERNWNKPQSHRHGTPSPNLSRHSSLSSLGSISPKHHRQGDVVHERERNWNSPHPVWHNGSSPRHSRNHSFSSPWLSQEHSRPVTPVDPVHKRERNWNAPRSVGRDSVSPQNSKKSPVSPLHSDSRIRSNSSSHEFSHANGHHHVPHSTKFQSTRPFSLHLPEKALRMSSPTPSHNHTQRESKPRNALNSPSQLSKSRTKTDVSPVTVKSSKGHLATSARTKLSKSPRNVVTNKSMNRSGANYDNHESDDSTQIQCVPQPSLYAWPALDLGHSDDSSKPVSNGRNQVRDVETDDLRETDVSSQSATPKLRVTEPPEMPDSHSSPLEIVATSEDYGKGLLIQNNQDDMAPDIVAAGTLLSPSPLPPGPIRRSVKSEFKTPSPPKELSELPTPSSSDNSRRSSPVQMPRMPDFGTPHQNRWMQTPKPPGGWLATPKPQVKTEESVGDDSATPSLNGYDKENQHPRTPVDDTIQQFSAKTPKPPGGWALTPGPVSSKLVESNLQEGQLLTPVNSLSKGSTLNLKTPGVPGGWGVTPAKKGLLKVRFDPETPEIKDALTSYAHSELHEDSDVVQADSTQNGLPPSPHSPRRVKANIRILDAFGREESSRTSPKKDSNASRNGIRVVDAKGREVKQESVSDQAKTEVEEGGVPPCRDELLSRLKQGLGNLVNDIDDLDNDREILGPDYPRIEELVKTSRQTRRARQNVYSDIKTDTNVLNIPFVKHPFLSFSRKTCIALVLVQIILFFMYRMSIIRARNLFFHAYYDPFNPELHLHTLKSDCTLHLDFSSTLWPKALLRAGREVWAPWFGFVGDYREYIWQFWTKDIQPSNSWPPT